MAVVFPAAYVIAGALLVLANAALLRLYLLRRDPGWLEDGEFERVRWPLGLVAVVRAVGGGGGGAHRASRGLQRCSWWWRSSSPSRDWPSSASTPDAWPGRRFCGRRWWSWCSPNPWAPQILALLGLFDNWFDFRKWAEPPKEGE